MYEIDIDFYEKFSVTRSMSPQQFALFIAQKQLIDSNDNRWTEWSLNINKVLDILSRC